MSGPDHTASGETVSLDHGSGGRRSRDLVRSIFLSRFGNDETDAAVVAGIGKTPAADGTQLAVTTDAHVVKPLFFPGGDIGSLAVFGTVNDLVVAGADPGYLTASFIIEEGFDIAQLERIADSMAAAAREAGVRIVAGDTKVVEKGSCDGLFITTTGVGSVPAPRTSISSAEAVGRDDLLLVNGPIGDHGAAVVCARNDIATDPPLVSDCASLAGVIGNLYEADVQPRFMRDATRGGLGTVLCELAEMRNLEIEVQEAEIPVREQVRGLCGIYGFDPIYLANEGTALFVVAADDGERALAAMRSHPRGVDAAVVGRIAGASRARVVMKTAIGGSRIVRMLSGEQLPRIC